MQNIFPPSLLAPQVTGHPQGLPGDRQPESAQTKIKPIADARNPEARLKDGLAPAKFWRAANGDPDPTANAAPPSIMQITISRMLDEQAPDPRSDAAPPRNNPLDQPPTNPRAYGDPTSAINQPTESKDARSSVLSTLP